jgi:ribosomal protein L11 methylase PrmA
METGVTTVTVYCRRKPARPSEWRAKIRVGLDQIKNCGLNIGSGKVTIAKIRRADWAESWKRHFKPIEIGNA